ncbi:MAG: adenosine deaminase family protein, partial [Candidatus Aminicenantales bacterium]
MSRLSRDFLERMPKVELHVHLEGAVPRPALDELARKYGRPPFSSLLDGDLPHMKAARECRPSFTDFVDVWLKIGGLLREYEDYAFIARAVSAEFKRRNILYAEVLFSPARDSTGHLQPERITEAVAAGFAEGPATALVSDFKTRASAAERDPRKIAGGSTSVRLVADLVRDNGPREAGRTLDALLAMNHRAIAGIGIGGSEAPFPPGPFAPVFEKARAAGLRTQAHAGESAGPESVWGAIRILRVDRIAHGVRAREDAGLMIHLREMGIPLDVCPTSNVRTGAVKNMADHPAADFLRRGIKISLSTDDPTLFGTDLAGEFDSLVRTFGLSKDEVRRLLLNGVDAAWCG